MNPTHSKIAYLVVIGQILLALIVVGSICACLFYKNYADPATLAAMIVLSGTLVGNLSSILGGPRQMMAPPEVTINNPPAASAPVAPQPERKP